MAGTNLLYVGKEQDSNYMLVACECDKLNESISDLPEAAKEYAAREMKVNTIKKAVLPYWKTEILKSCIPQIQKEKEVAIIKTLEDAPVADFFDYARVNALFSDMPAAYAKLAYASYEPTMDNPEMIKVGFLKGVGTFLSNVGNTIGNVIKPVTSVVGNVLQTVGQVIPGVGALGTAVTSIGNAAGVLTGSSASCGLIGGLFNTKACQDKQQALQQTPGTTIQQATNDVVAAVQQPQLPTNPVGQAVLQQAAADSMAQNQAATVIPKALPKSTQPINPDPNATPKPGMSTTTWILLGVAAIAAGKAFKWF